MSSYAALPRAPRPSCGRRRAGRIGLAALLVVACGRRRAGRLGLAALLVVGCAHRALPPAAARRAAAVDSPGQPGWVRRGTAAVRFGDARVFYGVGAASHIAGAALLRAAADERARAEVGRILGTVTRALMHDYASADGTQALEQALTTTSAMALQGVQVVDRYSAADGTLYALASLDAAALEPALAAAQARGLVHGDSAAQSVTALFDAQAVPPEAAVGLAAPPALPAAVAVGAATPTLPPAPALPPALPPLSGDLAAPAPVAVPPAPAAAPVLASHGAAPPAWVNGEDPAYPAARLLCAVGVASVRAAADDAAYAALARVFVAQVRASTRDFAAAYTASGHPEVDVQAIEAQTTVSTDALLHGVRVVAAHEADGAVYALACLERAGAAAALKAEIGALDTQAGAALATVGGLDAAARVVALTRVLALVLRREAANTQLRIVDPHGVGLPGPYGPADIAAAQGRAVARLRVGVRVQGPRGEDFAAAMAQGLTSHGYQLSDATADLDVLVTATIRLEPAGVLPGGQPLVRGRAAVEVKNVAQDRVFGALQESRKEGGRDPEDAERRAVRGLAAQLATEIGDRIDAAIRGQPARVGAP